MVKLEKFTPFAVFKPSEEPLSEKPKYRSETYLSLIKEKENFIQSLQNKKCKCIGVVIMLNPGSSKPEKFESTWRDGAIVQAKADPTMEQIEKCVLKAYGDNPPSEVYIEIFNLFNLCCASSKKFIEMYKLKADSLIKSKINIWETDIKREISWIWIAWGCDKEINDIKEKVYDKIIKQFPKNIIKFPCKNNKSKYGFWHPRQQIKRKQDELVKYISEQMSNILDQQNQTMNN